MADQSIVTQDFIFKVMQDFRDEMIAMHTRTRQTVDEGLRRIDARLDEHVKENRLVADRVLVMETLRVEAVRRAGQHGIIAGALAGTGVTAMLEVIKEFWGRLR